MSYLLYYVMRDTGVLAFLALVWFVGVLSGWSVCRGFFWGELGVVFLGLRCLWSWRGLFALRCSY